ncbi:hypothetical protein Celaphus_00000589 [Cervus elaphus hippelaphus]|uniref:SPATA31 domain-containing protein n=1 Tax=Cervus elaphus hippelaphus TaxID=46360 RepID=A0A212DBB3_CEREH|nr:hypothetical protein Celaphus_00000589 [Cervus elaphus hippelaphus]
MGGAHKSLYMTSANHPMKVLIAKPQSERELSPGRKHPEKVLGVLISKKAQQICEGQIPVNVHCSRLAANHFLDLPGELYAPTGTEDTDSSQDGEASMNTSHESLVVSPYIQQELEAYVLKFRVRHRWVLLLKVFKFIFNLKLKDAYCTLLPRSTLKATSDTGDHPKAQLAKDSGKHPQLHPGKKGITPEAVPHLERPLTAPSWATEETWQALEGPLPGNMQKPLKAPLTGQEVKPSSQDTTYNFVGRIWHSESVMEADRGSLESSPSPAMARNVPQEGSGGWTTPESCSSETVMDLNDCSPSCREQEAVEEDPVRKDNFEPIVLRSNTNPSLNTNFVDSNPEDVDFDEPFCKLEFRGFTDWQKQAQGQPSCMLRQDCATDRLLKDSHSDIFTATNTWLLRHLCPVVRPCPVENHPIPRYSMMLCQAESSQGQKEALRRQPQHKSMQEIHLH